MIELIYQHPFNQRLVLCHDNLNKTEEYLFERDRVYQIKDVFIFYIIF